MEEIQQTLAQLQQQYSQEMAAFQLELQKSTTPATNASLAADFASFRSFTMTALHTLQLQVQVLARSTDNMEMQSRKKILLLHGLPETKSEDVAAIVVGAVVDKMKVSDFSASSISRCHRMGRAATGNKPRPILVKFRDLPMRNKIWYAKAILKGTGITLSEFLTKTRHETFMAARQRFGVTQCWSREGVVFVLGSDGTRHRVTCLSELEQISVAVAAKSLKPAAVTKEATTTAVGPRRRAATGRK